MTLFSIGISHRTAPVALRERLTFSASTLNEALTQFGEGQGLLAPAFAELSILSTCNRLELYAVSAAKAANPQMLFDQLARFISHAQGVALTDFQDHLYRYSDLEAADHLGRVAAGLDSIVLGEPQILGQVTQAYNLAQGAGASGPTLAALFRGAIRAGKRARTETAIGRNATRFGSVAVRLAEEVVGPLTERQVVVVGAGEMAELIVEALGARGVQHLAIVNRTELRAIELAGRWGARALTLDALPEALQTAEVVFSATSAPQVVLDLAMTQLALASRTRTMALVDIAVPHDIDPAVANLPGVQLINLDQLQTRLNEARREREGEIPQVEAIVAESVRAFKDWRHEAEEILPVITDLRQNAERIRQHELARTLHYLPNLDEETRRQVEALTVSLVNKLLHEPTRHLRAEPHNGDTAAYVNTVRELFGLPRPPQN